MPLVGASAIALWSSDDPPSERDPAPPIMSALGGGATLIIASGLYVLGQQGFRRSR